MIFGKSVGKFSLNGIKLGKTKQVTVRCSLKQVVLALENLRSKTSRDGDCFLYFVDGLLRCRSPVGKTLFRERLIYFRTYAENNVFFVFQKQFQIGVI